MKILAVFGTEIDFGDFWRKESQVKYFQRGFGLFVFLRFWDYAPHVVMNAVGGCVAFSLHACFLLSRSLSKIKIPSQLLDCEGKNVPRPRIELGTKL